MGVWWAATLPTKPPNIHNKRDSKLYKLEFPKAPSSVIMKGLMFLKEGQK